MAIIMIPGGELSSQPTQARDSLDTATASPSVDASLRPFQVDPADACGEIACRLAVIDAMLHEHLNNCSPKGADVTGGYEVSMMSEALGRCIQILKSAAAR